ncbi:MAG: hypothetical protein Q8N81_04805 [bacterium]|nr:hypothetical protein [bacterium]
MKNPLTFKIESWLGSAIVLIFSAFLVGWFLIAMRNFNSDAEILNSSSTKLKIVSPVERSLIDQWLQQDNIGISASEVGYRYIVKKFPDKPWLAK